VSAEPREAPGGKVPERPGARLRRHFLTGILVLTPAVTAAWILYKLLAWVDGLLWDKIRLGWIRPGGIPGVGLVTVVILILLVGILVNNYVGRRFYRLWDSLLARIPLFNKIYLAIKQIAESLLSRETSVFRAVGLIEYPRKGIWSLVFLTETPNQEILDATRNDLRSVFLPTTPNPTSGFLLMVPEKEIHRLSMSVEEGLKSVISGGAYVPGRGMALETEGFRRSRRGGWWRRARVGPPAGDTAGAGTDAAGGDRAGKAGGSAPPDSGG